jgi:hypothetical protein
MDRASLRPGPRPLALPALLFLAGCVSVDLTGATTVELDDGAAALEVVASGGRLLIENLGSAPVELVRDGLTIPLEAGAVHETEVDDPTLLEFRRTGDGQGRVGVKFRIRGSDPGVRVVAPGGKE